MLFHTGGDIIPDQGKQYKLIEYIAIHACFLPHKYIGPSPGLHSEPKLSDLMNKVAAKIPSKWRDIGLQLGLNQGVLDGIATISPRDTNLCYSNMFTLWKNKNPTTHPYTWSTIVKVLEAPAVGQERLANKIKNKLTGQPPQ